MKNPQVAGLAENSDEFLAIVSFYVELLDIKCYKGWMHQAEAVTKARLKFSSLPLLRQHKVNWGIRAAKKALYEAQNQPVTAPERELVNA